MGGVRVIPGETRLELQMCTLPAVGTLRPGNAACGVVARARHEPAQMDLEPTGRFPAGPKSAAQGRIPGWATSGSINRAGGALADKSPHRPPYSPRPMSPPRRTSRQAEIEIRKRSGFPASFVRKRV